MVSKLDTAWDLFLEGKTSEAKKLVEQDFSIDTCTDFSLLNQDGKKVALSDFKGKKIILYFYPRDNTPGCNKQACEFGKLYPHFTE